MKKFKFMVLAGALSFIFPPLHSLPILAQDSLPIYEDATQTLMVSVNFVDSDTGRTIHTKKAAQREGIVLDSLYMFDIPKGYYFVTKPSNLFVPETERNNKNFSLEVLIESNINAGIANPNGNLNAADFDPFLPVLVEYPSATLDINTQMFRQKTVLMNPEELWKTDPITRQPMIVEEKINPILEDYPIDVPLLWKDNFSVCFYKEGNNLKPAFYTTLLSLDGLVPGFQTPVLPQGQQPVFRFYNQETGEHFYSLNQVTRKILGEQTNWKAEGYPFAVPSSSSIPIYRLKNPNNLDHHYTTDKNEYLTLQDRGWIGQGIAMYGADPSDSKAIPLYRLYNPNAQTAIHHYTSSLNECDTLVSKGWKAEDIGWYVYSIDE